MLETLSIKCFHPRNIVQYFGALQLGLHIDGNADQNSMRYAGPFFWQQLRCGVYHPEKMQPDAHYPPSSVADLQQQRQLENAGTTANKSLQFAPTLTQQLPLSCFRLLFPVFFPFGYWASPVFLEDMQTGGLHTGQHWQASHYVISIIHIQQGGKELWVVSRESGCHDKPSNI